MSENYTPKVNNESYLKREDPKVYVPKKPTPPRNK